MKKLHIPLIMLTLIAPTSVFAGGVTKCLDATGKITYTDKGCKSQQKAQDAYYGKDVKKRAVASKTTYVNYKISEIGSLTEQAQTKCGEKAHEFFVNSRPNTKSKTEAEFLEIVDRSIRGTEVEIIFSGVIHVDDDANQSQMKVQCTASKQRSDPKWTLVFKESN